MSCRGLVLAGGIVLLAPMLLSGAQGAASAGLTAGAAMQDITPPASALHPGDSIRDHLYARAIVIRNAKGGCAVLVGLDQGGARNEMVQDALARASNAIDCPRENFIISATHTHSGATGGLFGGLPAAKDVADGVVKAITTANARQAPARIGYGTTKVYLNINRDLFENQKWMQGANTEGESDKTLAVVALIGRDDLPIGIYMNYAMHPIDFYLSGVMSADFPGEASRYIERRYDQKTVAIFAQGASGNQNPLLIAPMQKLMSVRVRAQGQGDDRYGQPSPWALSARKLNGNADATEQYKIAIKPEELAAYQKAIMLDGEMASAMGTIIGESALDVMKNHMPDAQGTAAIAGGEAVFACPGRDRLDNSARQGVLPPYKDSEAVNITVGLLRIGDIDFVRVNGEVYNDIWLHLKSRLPGRKAMMVTLANGAANSGYIYSNEAGSHLTFQVISSRLKPGCAEDSIISSALGLASGVGQ